MTCIELEFSADRVTVYLRLRPQEAAVWGQLREAQRALPGTVRVVVLRGLTDLAGCDDVIAYQQACDWNSSPAYVSVAVLDGPASGPAFDLALGCDLRVVTPDAVLSAPGLTSAGSLARLLGSSAALELLATGRAMRGTEAYQRGLAHRLAPRGTVEREVALLVGQLLEPDRDHQRELKALLLGAATRNVRTQQAAQAEAVERLKYFDADGAPKD